MGATAITAIHKKNSHLKSWNLDKDTVWFLKTPWYRVSGEVNLVEVGV